MRAHAWIALSLAFATSASAADTDQRVLWRLEIDGNHAIATDELLDAIHSAPTSHIPVIGPFFGGVHRFDPVAFRADQQRIEHLYRRLGYFQAKVDAADVKPCSKEGRVCARLHVKEGEPTRIASLKVREVDSHPPRGEDELTRVLGLRAGEIFRHDDYLRAKTTMARYLRERSYPLPEVKGEVLYREAANTVDINITVKAGTTAKLGFISFDGLDQIRAEDAMARLPISTGMAYDPKLFDSAGDLLGDLDVFSTIDVELKPRQGDPGVADVVYHVHEKQLKTLQLGAGMRIENSRQEARGRVEWTNRNFYRHLRNFDARFEPRYAVLPSVFRPQQSGPLGDVDLSLKQPSFLSPWQDLRSSVGFDADLEQGYRYYGPRFGTALERRLNHKVTFGTGYVFRYLTFYDVDVGSTSSSSSAVPLELLQTGNYRLGFVEQHVRWDDRDDRVEPHRGTLVQFGVQESSQLLASAFTYFRAAPEVRQYFPETNRATLAMRAFFGRIAPLLGNATPITERFYGGGANDHRGFSYHRLSPQTLTSDARSVPVGGVTELLVSAEERVNLFRLGDHWVIGALFVDAGDVVASPSELDVKRLHIAAGPGLRYNSPIGVIRADLGVRLNRLGEQSDGHPNPDPGKPIAIHVSFGESF
ncbi:MAG: BamA/TamA family outer membrane protein [Deltaproteobacteria bacterium]|nr:BamA/TamA family outer membrane protein [Deltaproteobacteria bacterium]